jgi:hypothetical protein
MSDSKHGAEVAQLHAEIDGLRAQMEQLTALLVDRDKGVEVVGRAADVSEKRTDRRGLLKVAGAATIGAVGAGLLKAAPAAGQGIANGQAVQLGEANTCTATTSVATTVGEGLLASTTAGDAYAGVHGSDLSSGSSGVGVWGDSDSGIGVLGKSVSGTAILGTFEGDSGLYPSLRAAVRGDSGVTDGVIGLSSVGDGVLGATSAGDAYAGVNGADLSGLPSGIGVIGGSVSGIGVLGKSVSGTAVSGVYEASSGLYPGMQAAVIGDSWRTDGVVGLSSYGAGVLGATSANINSGVAGIDQSASGGYGVHGESANGSGVVGVANGAGVGAMGQSTSGYGVQAQGGKAQLYLIPAKSAGHPSTGHHLVGELFVDRTGKLYLCQSSGSPGTWRRLG